MPTCAACAAEAEKLLRCGACQSVWYCNAKCQQAGWKQHKSECKELKATKIRANMQAAAAELEAADAMRVLVQTDRIIITRCADPDDSVYMQIGPQPGINAWLQANQVQCWCGDVGTCESPEDAMFVVTAFAPSQLRKLRQPRTELELSDCTRERGSLESSPISAFGLRLRVTATPMIGQVSIGLKEVAPDPAAPLTAIAGTAVRATVFLVAGEAADRLALPPPMSTGTYAGEPRANAGMKVWCGVGESDDIVCADLASMPRVPLEALLSSPYVAQQPPLHLRAAAAAAAPPPHGEASKASASSQGEASASSQGEASASSQSASSQGEASATSQGEALASSQSASSQSASSQSAASVAEPLVAIGVMLERAGTSANTDEFEAHSIRAYLHRQHAVRCPEAAVPPFARSLVDDPRAIVAMQAVAGDSIRVAWMHDVAGG